MACQIYKRSSCAFGGRKCVPELDRGYLYVCWGFWRGNERWGRIDEHTILWVFNCGSRATFAFVLSVNGWDTSVYFGDDSVILR